MRTLSPLATALLITLVAGASPAMAQQGPGWVDPPPKAEPAMPPAAEPAPVAETPRDEGEADRATRAERLTAAYLATVSASNEAMLTQSPRFYAEHVRFHGRTMRLSALIAEKRRFVRRWPERRYVPQGAMQTTCEAEGETCTVRTAFAFEAASPARGARSRGMAELALTIRFGEGRPIIAAETSRVLRYGRPVIGADLGGGRRTRG